MKILDFIKWLRLRRKASDVQPTEFVEDEGEGDEEDVETVYYRPHHRGAEDEGTLVIGISIWGNYDHSSGRMEISPNSPDYAFWGWLIGRPEYARSITEEELAQAREEFARQTGN